jgi:hypothetical protein
VEPSALSEWKIPCSAVVSIHDSYMGSSGFESSKQHISTEVSRDFPHSLQANDQIIGVSKQHGCLLLNLPGFIMFITLLFDAM